MNITAGPYLQNVGKDRITIMWHTDEPGSSAVEYEASTRLGYSAYIGKPVPTFPHQVEEKQPAAIHALTLGGLQPCWEYFYRVLSVGPDGSLVHSEPASFRTAPPDDSPFRFVTYGDSHHVPATHARLAELARAHRPDIVVDAGDIVPDQIGLCEERFFAPTRELLRYTPFFAAMGNHDSNTEVYTRYFSYPEPRSWYSFNYGCAHFTVLNTSMDYRPGSEQHAWLQRDLETFRAARWKFVFFHHPPYCSNNCQIEGTRVLCPLFEAAGVDIVYNAHATHYERLHPLREGRYHRDGVVYLLNGGGGCDPTADYGQLWDQLHPFSAMAKGGLNFFVLTHVSPDEVTVRAVDSEGRVFDTATFRKAAVALPLLPLASPQLPYPELPEEGTVLAGFAEGPSRWVLPRPHFALDRAMSHSGNPSIRWDNAAGGVTCPALRRVLVDDGRAGRIVGGKAYLLSARIRTENVAGGITISLEWNGDMGFMERVESPALAGTAPWTEVRVRTPALSPYVYAVRALLSARPGSSGTAWFDDLKIEPVDADGTA